MLSRLTIQNYAIIDQLEIDLQPWRIKRRNALWKEYLMWRIKKK